MMNASRESSEFVEPAPRPPRSEPSTTASTPRHTLSATTETLSKPRIELLSDDAADSDSALTGAPTRSEPNDLDVEPTITVEPSTSKQASPSASSSSKPKVLLKSTSPDISLHVHLSPQLDHALDRKLRIAIRANGGILESRIAKADLIVIDPRLKAISRKLLKIANDMGQPIPVVTFDYINDSAAQGQRLDVDDPKYKFSPSPPAADAANLPAPTSRPLNGRNPYTEADRQAIISYFVDKDESAWSLNAAARELADRIPAHTYTSFQSYLQANFEKGWNLKAKVLAARREALEGDPSELQARILRSQYTPTPGPTEQSAPSDGWPRASPRPQVPTAEIASSRNGPEPARAAERSSRSEDEDEDDEQDLQVRQPNPGATINNVEKSPTKLKQPAEYASSESSSPGTSPPPSISLAQRIPGSNPFAAASSADEESDPLEYSPTILKELQHTTQSNPRPSQKARPNPRRAARSSDSSDDSELDQLDQDRDEDLLATGPPPKMSASAIRNNAEQSEDSEWEGSRRLDSKMLGAEKGDKRIKFTQDEKDNLLNRLVVHVMTKGSDLPLSTQDAIIAKPEDAFWEKFAADHPRHSVASWRSHYLKNRSVYKQMIDLMIQDRVAEQAEDSSDDEEGDGEEHVSMENQRSEELQGSDQAHSAGVGDGAAPRRSEQHESSSDDSALAEDMSIPADGIYVMITPLANERTPRSQRSSDQQWPEAPPPPPPMQDEDEDMLQVEAEIDRIVEAPESAEEESSVAQIAAEEDQADAGPELLEDAANNEFSYRHTESSEEPPVRAAQNATQAAHPRPTSKVEAGTPVLAQHRDAAFYDFTIDSDEEQRIRKARSRPSLPNMQSRQERFTPRQPRPRITADRVLGHFATPSRSQKPTSARSTSLASRQGGDDRIKRTREWARSVSVTGSSASPGALPTEDPVAITESSRSRASRIVRRPLLGAAYGDDLAPSRMQGRPQTPRRISSGRDSAANALVSPTPVRTRADQVEAPRDRRSSRSAIEAARMQYRAEVEQFRHEFDLDSEQLRSLLARFKANAKDARESILAWLDDMLEAYGVEAEVAFEYIKTSQGDFEQAETFLKLALMTRPGSTPNRSLSRSASYSASPLKRSSRNDQRGFTRAEASKRYRR